MKYPVLIGAMLVLALIVAACAPAETEVPIDTIEPTLLPTDPLITEAPIVTEPATEMPAVTDTAGIPVTGEPNVQVSETEEFGPILVNREGMSLYVFMQDTQNAGTSACADDCAAIWPPLTTHGDPAAGEEVDEAMLGSIEREDGTTQVTYNGRPLYLYVGDMTPGDMTGQGVEDAFGLWYLVSPTGEAIQQ